MNEKQFKNTDSWAIWGNDVEYTAGFPLAELSRTDFPTPETTKYVLVGINPGNDAANGLNYPNNFHGKKNSSDYRLRDAIRGTDIEEAFMTDADKTIDSDSGNITILPEHIVALFDYLDILKIKKDAKIIFMGTKFQSPLNKLSKDNRNVSDPIYPQYKLINPNNEPLTEFITNNKQFIKNENPLKYNDHKVYIIQHYSSSNNGHWNTEEVHAVLNLIAED